MRAVASGIDGVLYTQVPGVCHHFHVEHSDKRRWLLTSDSVNTLIFLASFQTFEKYRSTCISPAFYSILLWHPEWARKASVPTNRQTSAVDDRGPRTAQSRKWTELDQHSRSVRTWVYLSILGLLIHG